MAMKPKSHFKVNNDISRYLYSKGFEVFEGHSQMIDRQIVILKELASDRSQTNALEIGFNAGHSAELFLKDTALDLTSFDIGRWNYTSAAKEYMDETYPLRHELIIGDSTKTVPEFIKNNPNKKFDLIYIDGGHDIKIAKADIKNCRKLAHRKTIVIMDDTVYSEEWKRQWTSGPSKAWEEAIEKKLIQETSREEFRSGHGMSWGKYVFDYGVAELDFFWSKY
jgi:predicted O-methyltransferase YrrM